MQKAGLSPELQSLLERISERLAATGKSERGASEEAGLSGSTIRNIREGKVASPRLDTLRRLAAVLDTSVEWLAFGSDEMGSFGGARPTPSPISRGTGPAGSDFVKAAVQGTVQAGHFRQVEDFTDEEPVFESVERDREFPNARHAIFIAEGDSMNALSPVPIIPGARLVTIDYEDLKGQLPWRDKMVVIVEQIRDGGHLREWSVKQVELYEDRVEFCPRSTNPKHKPIVVPREYLAEDGKEVRALAIVRKIYNDVPL